MYQCYIETFHGESFKEEIQISIYITYVYFYSPDYISQVGMSMIYLIYKTPLERIFFTPVCIDIDLF